ncbi:MAG: 4Fe-4S binding protein [Desulfatiglandales bacterium]
MKTGDIGVILCRCRGGLDQRIDLGELKIFLTALEGVAFVDITDDLCVRPDPLKKRPSKGLVLACCSKRRHIGLFKEILERAKIPLFYCEFTDILAALGPVPISSREAAEIAKLILKAHIEKVRAAFETAPSAKAAGLKEVLGTRKERLTRRGFLRLPLMAAQIVAHYEESPVIDEKKCIADRSPCRECIRLCPFNALEFRKGKIHILEDQCKKCGFCATVCPVDALQVPTFSALQALRLVDALADDRMQVVHRLPVFTCDRGREELLKDKGDFPHALFNPLTVRVPCVASLTPLLLLRSLELGFEGVMVFCPDKACPKTQALKAWRDHMDSFITMIETLGITSRLVFLGSDQGAEHDLPQILKDLSSQQDPSPLNRHPTKMSFDSRKNLVHILDALGGEKGFLHPAKEESSLPFFDIQIDNEKCCLCGACARHCPAGALRIEEGPECQIQYAAIQCVGCKKCVDICPEDAVTLHRVMDLARLKKGLFLTKANDESARCIGCGQVVGKKRLLAKVEGKLKQSGFEELAQGIYYCQTCKNRALQKADEAWGTRHDL